MRILVTGGSGLIGRYVLAECIEKEFEVHAVTSKPDSVQSIGQFRAIWHTADLTTPGTAGEVVRRICPTHVIHCGWDTRHPTYWNSPANLSWTAATAEMARAFAETGGQRFVLAGTCAEYDWNHGYMVEGITPEKPSTLYGWCKLAAHGALHGAAAKLGFEAVTARIFFSYGPHENSDRFIPFICRTLAAGETPKLSSGRQLRDLMHAHDTARALLTLAEIAPAPSGAVNIGSGEPTTLARAATLLAGCAGRPQATGLGQLPDREDDPRVLLPSVDRLLSTGWRPKIDLEAGLAETYAWWARRRDGTEND